MRQSAASKTGNPWRIGEHRGKYVVIWDRPGRKSPARISTGTDDRGLAEAIASRIWNAHHKPVSGLLEHLWPVYEASRKADGVNPDKLKYSWAALSPHFAKRFGKNITRDDCRTYYQSRKDQGRSDSTVKTELEMLRACLNFHFKKDAPAIWVPPPSKPRDRWLTREEVTTLLYHVEAPHLRLFITLALTTAARMSAILDLTWDRVDWGSKSIDYLPAGRHKNNKVRGVVPFNSRAEEALKLAYEGRLTEYVIEYGGQPIKSVGWAMARLTERSGIKCSPHIFRHTAGVWMAQDDVSMEKIAQFLHTTVKIAEKHYARYSPSFMQEQAKALDW